MARSSGDAHPDQINMVGEETTFEGTLRAESNVRVSGHVKGKLDVKGRAIITKEGVIEGELHATDADVAGSVQGEIHVTERLMLKSTARIDGNVETGRIKVEEGALFAGQCEIGEQVSEKVQKQIGEKGPRERSASSSSGSSSNAPGGAPSSPSQAGGGTDEKSTAGNEKPAESEKSVSRGAEASGGRKKKIAAKKK